MPESKSQLDFVACPLCYYQSAMRRVKRLTDPDEEILKYGDIYGSQTTSDWKICGRCGFIHQNPRPSIQALNTFYANSDYHQQISIPQQWQDLQKYMKFAEWYYREKIDFALDRMEFTQDKVFDLGFGHGGILKMLELEGWQPAGVEPDENLFSFAKETLGLSGIYKTIFDESFNDESNIGLVVSNHTMEHVADLDSVMKGISKMIRPGAYMLTVIPTYYRNRSSLSRRWMNASHYSMFNHRSLGQLSAKFGFEEVAYSYRGWWKEIDDLWYLARYTGEPIAAEQFYEVPEEVEYYVNVRNPINSVLHWPVHGPHMNIVKRRIRKIGLDRAWKTTCDYLSQRLKER